MLIKNGVLARMPLDTKYVIFLNKKGILSIFEFFIFEIILFLKFF